MATEMHLFVIWSKGRFAADRILSDIRERFEIVHVAEMKFPDKAAECYCRFYNTRNFNVRKKVTRCGKGPFLVIIIKVNDTRQIVDRYGKTVNALMYEKKEIYRDWCGGKFRVHSTLHTSEFARDIYLLTGHNAKQWEKGVPSDLRMNLPPFESIPPPPKESLISRIFRHLKQQKRKG